MDNPAVSVSDTPAKAFPSSSGEMFDQYFTQGSKCSFKKNELLEWAEVFGRDVMPLLD